MNKILDIEILISIFGEEKTKKLAEAANFLDFEFSKQGIDKWALFGVCSRKSADKAYNSGLDTAISLAKEHGDCEALVCGLENSKKRI